MNDVDKILAALDSLMQSKGAGEGIWRAAQLGDVTARSLVNKAARDIDKLQEMTGPKMYQAIEQAEIKALAERAGVSEEEIDFSTVNENFDMLEAGTNDIFGLLEGPEGVTRYASLIRPDSPLIVDAGGFEPDRVARLRSFMSKVKGFIFEIRKLDVDAQIDAQRNLEELLASEEKSRILDTRSFIILDSKNRSLEFRIPIEFNEKSIQVLCMT